MILSQKEGEVLQKEDILFQIYRPLLDLIGWQEFWPLNVFLQYGPD